MDKNATQWMNPLFNEPAVSSSVILCLDKIFIKSINRIQSNVAPFIVDAVLHRFLCAPLIFRFRDLSSDVHDKALLQSFVYVYPTPAIYIWKHDPWCSIADEAGLNTIFLCALKRYACSLRRYLQKSFYASSWLTSRASFMQKLTLAPVCAWCQRVQLQTLLWSEMHPCRGDPGAAGARGEGRAASNRWLMHCGCDVRGGAVIGGWSQTCGGTVNYIRREIWYKTFQEKSISLSIIDQALDLILVLKLPSIVVPGICSWNQIIF